MAVVTFEKHAFAGNIDKLSATNRVSTAGGAFYGGAAQRTTNFILQGVSFPQQERASIVDTFGESTVFFGGKQNRVLSARGLLVNSGNFEWKRAFLRNYDKHLRGTRLAERNCRAYLCYDTTVVGGYLLGVAIDEGCEDPFKVPLQFTMLVAQYKVLPLSSFTPGEQTTAKETEWSGAGVYDGATGEVINLWGAGGGKEGQKIIENAQKGGPGLFGKILNAVTSQSLDLATSPTFWEGYATASNPTGFLENAGENVLRGTLASFSLGDVAGALGFGGGKQKKQGEGYRVGTDKWEEKLALGAISTRRPYEGLTIKPELRAAFVVLDAKGNAVNLFEDEEVPSPLQRKGTGEAGKYEPTKFDKDEGGFLSNISALKVYDDFVKGGITEDPMKTAEFYGAAAGASTDQSWTTPGGAANTAKDAVAIGI